MTSILFASLGSVVAACGAPEDARVTIRFWGMGREGEVVAELVKGFERENPGIRVRVQQIPWSAAHEKLLTAYVGEVTPDVAQLGNTWVPEFSALGALAPLDSLVGRSTTIDPADFFEGIWKTNLVGDTLFGIPWYVDTRLIFFRTDILSRAGYETPPSSWAEWRTAMERIRAEAAPGQYPLFLPTNEWPQPVILALQAGSRLLSDGGRYGAFSEPEFRRAFEFYTGLFEDSLAPPVSSNQIANIFQEFAAGNFAMIITGPWYIGEFRRRLPAALQDKWATAPMPGPTGAESGVSMAGGSSLVVFRGGDHPEAAWKLVEYLSRPAQQREFWRLTGDLPARLETWEEPALKGDPITYAFWEQLQRVEPLPAVPEIELIVTKVFEAGERAVQGGAPVDRVLADLDASVDRILEKRRWMLDQAAVAARMHD
ncbi:MAG TPA: sugar ABC transporter substrate-binding protein [Gemmatimonadales bacterium]|nr:sugar ABC transporter substrate-binding protein [Gemmatimonadales bacterium]